MREERKTVVEWRGGRIIDRKRMRMRRTVNAENMF